MIHRILTFSISSEVSIREVKHLLEVAWPNRYTDCTINSLTDIRKKTFYRRALTKLTIDQQWETCFEFNQTSKTAVWTSVLTPKKATLHGINQGLNRPNSQIWNMQHSNSSNFIQILWISLSSLIIILLDSQIQIWTKLQYGGYFLAGNYAWKTVWWVEIPK